jgi:nucleoside 2-deoxyribosyltransferase
MRSSTARKGDAVTTGLRIYLAGPDVFLAEAAAVLAAKRKLCATYGFIGVAPVDGEADLSKLPKHAAALRIGRDNEDTIRSCDVLIANLTPFRGPSADVGTAYELGFARALGLPVFAYTNVAGSLLERTRDALGAQVQARPGGGFEDADGMLIEDFDCADNLMLVGAVEDGGGRVVINSLPAPRRFTDLTGFETCLKLVVERFGIGSEQP